MGALLLSPLRCLLTGAGSLLAPRACLGCRVPLPCRPPEDPAALLPPAWVCARCAAGLERIGAACRFCGRSRGALALPAPRCAACAHEPGGGVALTVALLRYRRVARRLLHRLKYGGAEELALPLGRALGRRVGEVMALHPDLVVVPVPLHPWRRLRRGFDQAAELALGVAEALERPCLPALRRRRWTRPLFRLPHDQRAAVVEGAFRAHAPATVRGRPILLVDDIRTSGATLRAAASALRLAGTGRVVAAVVAR